MKKKFKITDESGRGVETPVRSEDPFVLRLYVSGMTPRSTAAFASIKAICDKHLYGRYDLEVIDVYQQPSLAKVEQIVAAPTLVKRSPSPVRRLVGNLSQEDRVLTLVDSRRKPKTDTQ